MRASRASSILILAAAAWIAATPALAEPSVIEHRLVPHTLSSGNRDNPAGAEAVVFSADVTVPDAPWVRLTRLYLRAAALPEGDRAEMLGSERDALLALTDDPVAQLMAADIARQLGGARPAEAYALLGDEPRAQTESSVEAALRQMRRAAIEAGN